MHFPRGGESQEAATASTKALRWEHAEGMRIVRKPV